MFGNMNYDLTIGGIWFHISSQRELTVTDQLSPFLDHSDWKNRVNVSVTWDYARAPVLTTQPIGRDLIQEYYRQDSCLICAMPEGHKGFAAITACDPDFSNLTCYINATPFLSSASTLATILRFLPMRAILQHYGVQFFHAAQIALDHLGILFTAPSGTGKTTQAKLWRSFRNARIVCNDRTLIRDGRTYGYPVDGSEPVFSSEVNALGAIVFLRQSRENRVLRMKATAALSCLMPQLVIDTWNPQALEQGMNQLIALISHYPVYALDCLPDESAVECLEQALTADGVI